MTKKHFIIVRHSRRRGFMAQTDMKFPPHKGGMHLVHNQHHGYYQTVTESIEREDHGYRSEDWVSEEQKRKAIGTDDCWFIQWYPETPTGFCLLAAADLDVLLAAACARSGQV